MQHNKHGVHADGDGAEGKLVLGVHHSAICTGDVERSLRFWRDGLGFTEGVRRITVAAPAGTAVAMAVITAPDGVLVEVIGPAQ